VIASTLLSHVETESEPRLKPKLEPERNRTMKSYKAYSESAYLKKEDFPDPEVDTIVEAQEENVTAPGKKPKAKIVLYFEGRDKGLVLNMENGDRLFEITGTDNPEKWIGTSVELYHEPNVTYGGKRIGGLRLRKSQETAARENRRPEPVL
jgi:hypothetical protein